MARTDLYRGFVFVFYYLCEDIIPDTMTKIGTTFTNSGKKAVLCGSGELGKEVAIELQRYGVEVVALDKYANAPAMHIAKNSTDIMIDRFMECLFEIFSIFLGVHKR